MRHARLLAVLWAACALGCPPPKAVPPASAPPASAPAAEPVPVGSSDAQKQAEVTDEVAIDDEAVTDAVAVVRVALEPGARPEISAELLQTLGFQISWDSNIRDEILTSVSIEGGQLYIFTESKRLYQADMASEGYAAFDPLGRYLRGRPRRQASALHEQPRQARFGPQHG